MAGCTRIWLSELAGVFGGTGGAAGGAGEPTGLSVMHRTSASSPLSGPSTRISSRDLPAGIFSVPTDSRLSDVQPPVLPIFPVSEASPTRMRKPLPARSSAIAHSSHTSYSTAFGDSISQAT